MLSVSYPSSIHRARAFFSLLLMVAVPTVTAANIAPNTINVDMVADQTINIERTVTLDATGPAANRVDVIFLADNTGSMGGVINTVRNNAHQILDAISGGDPRFVGIDVQFGVASYNGDPREFGGTSQSKALNAYKLHQPITPSRTAVNTALSQWRASGGGDGPEANFFALHQVATSGAVTDGKGSTDAGYSTGYLTEWRPDAARVVVWFGDIESHTTSVDLDEVIAALKDNKVIVAAINSRAANSGIDTRGQASAIVAAAGGSLTNNVQGTQTTVNAILNAVQSATATVDLSLATRGNTSGLDIQFECISAQGCNGVAPGESRRFNMQIRARTLGDYSFETYVPQIIGAVAQDVVHVRNCVSKVNAFAKRDKAELIWTDSGAGQYAIYRSDRNNANYRLIGKTTSRYSVYVDRGLSVDTNYFYQVKELDAAGNPVCSSLEVSATTNSRARPDTTPINLPPVISSAAPIRAVEDSSYRYDVVATDPNGDALSLLLVQAPAGMQVNGSRITWIPENHQVGQVTVVLRAQDPAGLFVDQVFTIDVVNTNDAPQILSSAPTTARVDQTYEYNVNAIDIDVGDALQYSLRVSPSGMTLDGSGKLRWTPLFLQQGPQSVTLRVTDKSGAFAEESFVVDVEAVNRPPRITSTPPTIVAPGAPYTYQLEVVDPNEGDIRQFRLLTGPSGLTINENTGLIHWPVPVAGTYSISAEVRDYAGLTDVQTYDLVVQQPNAAPTFSSDPVLTASEGAMYRYRAVAVDADGDLLSYSLVEFPQGMTINENSGEISWVPTSSQVASHEIVVRASDGRATVLQSYSVTVAARANTAPVFSSSPITTVITGEPYSYQAVASDAESDPITYSLVTMVSGASISAEGLLQWVAGAPGIYPLVIAATDDRGASTLQSFSLEVREKPNNPPVFNSAPVTSITVGDSYSYSIVATDPDGDPVTTSLVKGPLGMVLQGNSLNWVPSLAQVGAHPIEVRVTDSRGASATQSFNVIVNEQPNSVPVFSSVPITSVMAGDLYQYQVQASDPDGDSLTYSASLIPAGANLSPSGLLTWQTTDADEGSHTIRLRATDARGAYAEQAFVLNVLAVVNLPPTISSTPVTQAQVGRSYSYAVVANDPEGQPLSYSLAQAPAGMAIDPSGLIRWTPAANQSGNHPVTVTVADGKNSITQNFTVQVSEPTDLTVSIVLSSAIVVPDQTVTIQVLAPGAVNPSYSLSINGTRLALDAAGMGVFSTSTSGIYHLEAGVTGSDGATGTAQAVLRVKVTSDNTPPVATIATPLDGAVILEPTALIGTVTDANLYRYRLFIAEAGSTDFTEFALGSVPVSNSALATFNPSQLKNGLYTILLKAEDINGLEAQDTVDVRVEGELKPGVVQLSFVDMTVPVAGIPITIERNYDSRVKSRRDLGVGWNLSIRQGEYKNNREPGKGWGVVSSGGFIRTPCFSSVEQAFHLTDIRLSEREAYQFRPRFNLFGFGSVIGGGCLGQVEFVQVSGPAGALLQPIGSNSVVYLNGTDTFTFDLGDEDFGEPWEPSAVRMTTPDGRVFDLDLRAGITRLQNANGNQLFISNNGVVNSSGQGVVFTRDTNGRITLVRDPLGNEVRYSYDLNNNLIGFTNQLQEQTTYQYHSAPFVHHLKSITLPDGKVVSQFNYDADGRLSQVCDTEGCSRADYDLVGRTQTNIDATNRATTYVYDQRGNVTSKRDALGNTETFKYDNNGNLLEYRDAEGNLTARTWDANGNMLSITLPHEAGANPAHFTTLFNYDTKGNLLSVTEPSGAKTVNTYDARSNLLSITDESGALLSKFTYDANGRQTSEADPFGSLTYTYGSNGYLNSLTDEAGVVTNFTHNAVGNITGYTREGVTAALGYDRMGRPTTHSYSDGVNFTYGYGLGVDWSSAEGNTIPKVQRSFNGKGAIAQITDANGATSKWEYDASGRVTAEVDALNQRTSYEYDAAGRLLNERDAMGNPTAYERDRSGRLLKVTNGENESIGFSYYPDGRVKSTTDPTGFTWRYAYTPTSATVTDELLRSVTTETNSQGLITRIINADGTERRWNYLIANPHIDGADSPTSFIDEAGRSRNFTYDSLGRMLTASDFSGETASYSYDSNGLNKVTDAEGEGISFLYGADGQISRLAFADGSFKSFEYDANRRLKSVSLASGDTRMLSYDEVGRLVSDHRSAAENFDFSWDKNSNLLTATNALGTTSYEYNANNATTRYRTGTGESLSYEYDRAGRITAQILSNDSGSQRATSRYEYDEAGRLLSITDHQNRKTLFSYDRAGRMQTRTQPNGITATYSYDLRDQITAISYTKAGGGTIASISYTRNPGGEPNKISWHDGSYVLIGYDTALRVISERFYSSIDTLQRQIHYEYDKAGNRTARTIDGDKTNFNYGVAHRLLSASGAENHQYQHDANGWVNSIVRPDLNANLTYNFAGQIASLTRNGTTYQYTYDAAGNRIQVSGGTRTQRFVKAVAVTGQYENPQGVFDADSNLIQSYLYAGDAPLQRTSASGTVYYLTDAMGSVIGLTDADGNLQGTVKYDAYGVEFDQSGNMALPDSAGGDFRFHGQWKDAVSGLYYLRARDYDPVSGRFLSTDPAEPDLREPESINRYAFANSNPYWYLDPSGRFTLISVNISLNIQATLRSIAINIAKDYLIDKATSVAGSLVLSALKNFAALESFNPWGFVGVNSPKEAGRVWEQKIQNYICSLLPGALREIVWFEPAISGGYASANGYGCPGGGGTFALKGSAKPDFILSKTQPTQLGKPPKSSIKAYLIGESKWRLKTFYNDYVLNRGKKREQLRQIAKFASDRVYSRTAVFLALKDGTTAAEKGELSAILVQEAVKAGAIPVMVSAQ